LLQEKVREAMDSLLGMVRNLVQEGIKKGEVKQEVDPEFVATVFISTLEGALALSKLYKNQEYMKRAVHHLRSFLDQTCS
jgi:hypothetical protein